MTYFEMSTYFVSLAIFTIALFLAIINIPLIWNNRTPRILGNLFFARNIALIISTAVIIGLKISVLFDFSYTDMQPLSSTLLIVVEYMLSIVLLIDCAITRALFKCDRLSVRRMCVIREGDEL